MFGVNMGGGAFDSSNAVWSIEMWKNKAPSVLCLSQMMYGFGSILGPLITKPYVRGDISNSTDGSNTTTTPLPLNTTTDDDINYSIDRRPLLEIPFMTAGVITLSGN